MRRVIGLFMIVWMLAFIGPVLAQDVTPVIPVEVEPSRLESLLNLLLAVMPLAVIVNRIVEGLKPTIKKYIQPTLEDGSAAPGYVIAVHLAAFGLGGAVAWIFLDQMKGLPVVGSLPDGWLIVATGLLASFDSNLLHRAAEFFELIGGRMAAVQAITIEELPEPKPMTYKGSIHDAGAVG